MYYITINREHFNSQPHEEADYYDAEGCGRSYISTHSLTRRLTQVLRYVICLQTYFNSQPHEEADSNFKQKSFYLKLFFIFIA